jgi:phytoene dehydrogenase-like protein
MRTRYDAIIVGGGHNGLVAAFYLAQAGKSVLVLERRHVVGGPAATVEYFPGYRSAITNSPGSLEPKIVADMRLEQMGLRWIKPDPAVVMPFPDGRFFVGWRDQNKVRENLARNFSVHDAQMYPKVFEFFNDFAKRLKISLFEAPPTIAEITARLKTAQDNADFATVFFGTIRQFLEDRLETDEIRTAIAMLSMAGAVGPSTPGTPLALMQRPMSLFSSRGAGAHDPRNQPMRGSTGLPVGGMGAIIDAMVATLERMGVDIKVNAEVNRVTVDAAERVCGVVLSDGSEIGASIVSSNLDPRTTLLKLVEPQHVPAEIRERLSRIPKGGSTFKVVLAVDSPPHFAGAPHGYEDAYSSCQIRIAPNMAYLEKAHHDYIAGRSTDSPRLLGLVPSFTDPTLAPEGKHLLSFNAWYFAYDLEGTTWASEREVVGNRIVNILTQYMPSLKQSIVGQRFFSPLDLETEYGLIAGNFSHLDMTPAHMFAFRPIAGMSDYRTPIAGLYLSGSGNWPGGTVTGLPGHNAAQAMLKDLADGRETRTREPADPATFAASTG